MFWEIGGTAVGALQFLGMQDLIYFKGKLEKKMYFFKLDKGY